MNILSPSSPSLMFAQSQVRQNARQNVRPSLRFSGEVTREYFLPEDRSPEQLRQGILKDPASWPIDTAEQLMPGTLKEPASLPMEAAVFTKAYLATCLNRPDRDSVNVTVKPKNPFSRLRNSFTLHIKVPEVSNCEIAEALDRDFRYTNGSSFPVISKGIDVKYYGDAAVSWIDTGTVHEHDKSDVHQAKKNENLEKIVQSIEKARTRFPYDSFNCYGEGPPGKANLVARKELTDNNRPEKNENLLTALKLASENELLEEVGFTRIGGLRDSLEQASEEGLPEEADSKRDGIYRFRVKNTPYNIVYNRQDGTGANVTVWYECLTRGTISQGDPRVRDYQLFELHPDVQEQVIFSAMDPNMRLAFQNRLFAFFKDLSDKYHEKAVVAAS